MRSLRCKVLAMMFFNINLIFASGLSLSQEQQINFKLIEGTIKRVSNFLKNNLEAEIMLGSNLEDVVDYLEIQDRSASYGSISIDTELDEEGRLEQLFYFISKMKFALYENENQLSIFRIKLFIERYAKSIFDPLENNSIALATLSREFNIENKTNFNKSVELNLKKIGCELRNNSFSKIIYLATRSYSDTGCKGKNRNILDSKLVLLNIITSRYQVVGEIVSTSCKFKEIDKEQHLQLLSYQISKSMNSACLENGL